MDKFLQTRNGMSFWAWRNENLEPHILVIESNDCGTWDELNVGCTDHYLSNVNSPALFHLQVDTSDSEHNSA